MTHGEYLGVEEVFGGLQMGAAMRMVILHGDKMMGRYR
jgi:hypothetical protein